MNNPFHWTIRNKRTFEPKTHFKRTCVACLEFHGKAGCSLPFRKKKLRPYRLFLLKEIVYEKRNKKWGSKC